ncbi:UNVERIFIED_CONTAM: hypothetical protein FKN15_054880 [Acipenser sinensis]
MKKLWAAVYHQGTGLAELLRECSAPPAPPVPSGGPQETTSADWQQQDMLSIAASDEVGEQELAFPSEDLESDSRSPAVKLYLLPLIKRATAVLQVPRPTKNKTRQSIFDDEPTIAPVSPPEHPDFLFEIQLSWDHPATALAVSRSMDTLYRVHDMLKLGLVPQSGGRGDGQVPQPAQPQGTLWHIDPSSLQLWVCP